MTKNFNVRVEIDWVKAAMNLRNAHKSAQAVADNQILKDSNKFIPMDRSDLAESGIRMTKLGKGKIIWDTPYAKRLYYNPQYNFSKDKNPLAGGLWFERAKAQNFETWVRLCQEEFNKFFDDGFFDE